MYFVLSGSVLVHAVRCLVHTETKPKLGESSELPPLQTASNLSHQPASPENSRRNLNWNGRDRVAGEHIVSKGDIFGEGALFPSELGDWRQENAKALSWVSACVLSAAALREITAVYPEVPATTISPGIRIHAPPHCASRSFRFLEEPALRKNKIVCSFYGSNRTVCFCF